SEVEVDESRDKEKNEGKKLTVVEEPNNGYQKGKSVEELCQEVVEILKSNSNKDQWLQDKGILARMLSKEENYSVFGTRITIPLIQLMTQANSDLAEEATKAVGNIAYTSAQLRDVIVQSNGVEALKTLCGMLKELPISFVRVLSETFVNISCHTKSQVSIEVLGVMVQCLLQLLQFEDHEVCKSAIGALRLIAYERDQRFAQKMLVRDSGILSLVFKHLADAEDDMVLSALGVLSSVAAGDDDTLRQSV
ncbi:hypothetical protein PMAYCL1PPCAC_20890, partial [Pristionchus mayeri]